MQARQSAYLLVEAHCSMLNKSMVPFLLHTGKVQCAKSHASLIHSQGLAHSSLAVQTCKNEARVMPIVKLISSSFKLGSEIAL